MSAPLRPLWASDQFPANLLALAVHVLLPVLAIHIQGDDGTALVFLGIGLVMVFAGGISGWLVAGGLAAAGGGAALLLKLRPGLLKGYQAKRIFAVLDPENPALADIAYQQNKGAMAIGTGGLTGTGLWGEHVFVPNSTTSMMSRGNPIDSNVETMEIRKLTTYIAALVTTTITFATTFEDTFTRFAAMKPEAPIPNIVPR